MPHRFLTALPVFNEVNHVGDVIAEVRKYSPNVLVINDGSTDGTSDVLAGIDGIQRVDHPTNTGYGAA
ncbi:MAG: glycosyltransferase, partial [Pirellulales bacterium]